jgi:V/A-type H+/Na+-transporting ATPase subunit D
LENVSATRINLIQTRKTLSLAESGRDILERKRDVLLRELRTSIFEAEKAREELVAALLVAYLNLREAQLASGSETVETVALGSSFEADFLLDYRSVMGVTVPIVEFRREIDAKPDYGFANTSTVLDMTFKQFYKVLNFVAELARAEGTVFQIANDVRKTQRRVNALSYVLIPQYRETAKRIEQVLEEKEREEFVRTKRIKNMIKKPDRR